MNRRVKYRKSYTVRTRLSRRASSAKATAFSNDTVRSYILNTSTPAAMHRKARFVLPFPDLMAAHATWAASNAGTPLRFNNTSAAISS